MPADQKRRLPRREFIQEVGTAAAIAAWPSGSRLAVPRARAIRAVAFDGFAVFDPTPVLRLARDLVPSHAADLVALWRSRQFEYQWLRTLGGRYADFTATAADGLTFAARSLGLALTDAQRERLLESYLTLVPWAGAGAALGPLRAAGLSLGFLSNMTERMLREGAERAGLAGAFDHWLSTDRVRAAKPDPRAYRMATEAFGLPREAIAFVAFASWDATGAAWFGFPTIWTNRLGLPAEDLGAAPVREGRDLSDVPAFVREAR